MTELKRKFRLHRAVIVLACLALLVALLQGASWFSQNHQKSRNAQFEELGHTLARQVGYSLVPLMKGANPDIHSITTLLDQLTHNSRVLDAAVYDASGALVAHSGENISVSERLALHGNQAGSYLSRQIVEPIAGNQAPLGSVRLTLDTHTLATDARQVDNTTNVLRLMLLLALAIGIVLTRTLLQGKRTRWQQSPYLLTASKVITEDNDDNPPTGSRQDS